MSVRQPTGADPQALYAWARQLVDDINRFLPTAGELPLFADDAEAADGRVKVGEEYVTPEGFRKRRMA